MRKVAAITAIVVGVIMAIAGVVTWVVISSTLSDQKITVSDDANCAAGLVRARRRRRASTSSRSPTTTPPTAGPRREAAAERSASRWCRGMEISTRHRGGGVHLLAYLPDPAYPPLADELAPDPGRPRARACRR